ncbi:MAG: B12-binding domain-containing radical SAM protein [Proteobacteria bacterium]|nr:B12-binding domain-containing radical SAM protein [Pseudomonadota bacterium]
MKILLINTPRSPHNAILDHATEASLPFIHKKLIGPPLGLLTIAAALPSSDVTLLETKAEIDLYSEAPEEEQPRVEDLVKEYLDRAQPDVVGVTFIASEFNAGIEIFKVVKGYNKEIVTIAGGLHTTLCPEDFKNDMVDIVCPGQATEKIRHIVHALENDDPLENVRGIYLNRNGRTIYTGSETGDVDTAGADFVMPDRSLLKRWISTYKVGRSPDPATYIFSSLGCPYKCTFCSIWPQYDGSYYRRGVESIVEELKTLDDYPVVRFADANTLVEKEFMEQLFDRIEQEGIEKFFIMDMRVDAIVEHPQLIEKLARGGLRVVISGFESFRNRELARYNKSSEGHLIEKAVEIFHANGIMIRGNYVIPPDYDRDDFKALKEYAQKNKVAYAGYTILTPMPGTTFFEEIKDQIVDTNLDKYNFFNSVLKTTLPTEEFYREVAALWAVRKGKEVI